MPVIRAALRLAIAVAVAFPATAMAADHGATVFEETCAACHRESLSAAETDHVEDLLAPPMNLLTTIIRKKTGNSEAAFVAHVVDFTFDPAEEKIKAMPDALQRFGLMPPIETIDPTISRADIAAVAQWLFTHYDYETELRELMEHQGEAAQE